MQHVLLDKAKDYCKTFFACDNSTACSEACQCRSKSIKWGKGTLHADMHMQKM